MALDSIGVLMCDCGGKIGRCLDAARAAELPGVRWAGRTDYACSPRGLGELRAAVIDHKLDRVIVAGCAPRTHLARFRRELEGLVNPALVSLVNVRDLCAWPHEDDLEGAAAKARDQVAMAVADLAARRPGLLRTATIAGHAVVIGGGLAGMTAALGLSDVGIPVTLVERAPDLGGPARFWPDDRQVGQLASRQAAAIRTRSGIQVRTNTQVMGVSGPVGHYHLELSQGDPVEAGAVVVAIGAVRPLPCTAEPGPARLMRYVFVLCDVAPDEQNCSRACCLSTYRQAADIKRQAPGAEVSIAFRELYTGGGAYDDLVWEAQAAGVQFYRYPAGGKPGLAEGNLALHDELRDQDVSLECDILVELPALRPQPGAADLARMLRLPLDQDGFMAEVRTRLRPAERIDRGIYVCGAAHRPCDAQRALFEAASTAARAARHIRQGQITSWASLAEIDESRCNGCGDCVQVCPFTAVALYPRPQSHPGLGGLARIDPLLCTGCGNCVSVCPVKAAQVATATDEGLEAQVRESIARAPAPGRITLVLGCEWSGYSAAEIAGAHRLRYPASTRIIRLDCTGRLHPGLILKALEMGVGRVLILGCAPGVCHYEQGNERCAAVFEQAHRLARLMALDDRLRLEWMTPDDGEGFVRLLNDWGRD